MVPEKSSVSAECLVMDTRRRGNRLADGKNRSVWRRDGWLENYLHEKGRPWFASLMRLFCFETKRLRFLFPCPDVQPTRFFGLMKDVCFRRRGHLKQLVVWENVYVLVYGSAVQLREGLKKKESFEGKIEEYSRILGRDALKTVVVVGDKGKEN